MRYYAHDRWGNLHFGATHREAVAKAATANYGR